MQPIWHLAETFQMQPFYRLCNLTSYHRLCRNVYTETFQKIPSKKDTLLTPKRFKNYLPRTLPKRSKRNLLRPNVLNATYLTLCWNAEMFQMQPLWHFAKTFQKKPLWHFAYNEAFQKQPTKNFAETFQKKPIRDQTF